MRRASAPKGPTGRLAISFLLVLFTVAIYASNAVPADAPVRESDTRSLGHREGEKGVEP
jgi:hypothetical protein